MQDEYDTTGVDDTAPESEPLSFADRLQFSGGHAMTLLQGVHAGGYAVFAYVKLTQEEYARLQADIKRGGSVDFSHYGEILTWGAGRPTDEQIQYMEEVYGFSHAEISFLQDRLDGQG